MVERVTRIELALSAWEADVLPLNYTRMGLAPSQASARINPQARPARTSYRMAYLAVTPAGELLIAASGEATG